MSIHNPSKSRLRMPEAIVQKSLLQIFFAGLKLRVISGLMFQGSVETIEISEKTTPAVARLLEPQKLQSFDQAGHTQHAYWLDFQGWANKRGLAATLTTRDDGNECWYLLDLRPLNALERIRASAGRCLLAFQKAER